MTSAEQSFWIGDKRISREDPVYVVAEAGVNHNGNIKEAHRLIEIAARAGADAVKFQAFVPAELCSEDTPLPLYAHSARYKSQLEMLETLALPLEAFAELKIDAQEQKIEFLCTPFDRPSLEMLISLDLSAYKFASTDLTNFLLLRRAAETAKPLLLSTGASRWSEIDKTLKRVPESPVLLFHCTSSYPTSVDQLHLSTITKLIEKFGRPTGFSDHSMGREAAGLAIALGACMLEKHFTRDPQQAGPDHSMSAGPDELALYVEHAKRSRKMMGTPRGDECFAVEKDVRQQAGRSLYARVNIQAGETFREDMLVYRRPAGGLTLDEVQALLGKRASKSIAAGTRIDVGMIANE